jgi:hypothetical protein
MADAGFMEACTGNPEKSCTRKSSIEYFKQGEILKN